MIAEYIEKKYYELKASKIKQYTHANNNASEIGHPCERFLVFSRTRFSEKPLHNVELQCIFDEGANQEKSLIRDLLDAGIEFVEAQRAFYDEKLQLSGRIDGMVVFEGEAYPVEIKSMNPFSYEKIHSVQDMMEDLYAQKYPAQLTLYLYLTNKEKGLFILKNKSTGVIKAIDMMLDYEYAEELIKKIERINKYVETKTVPDVNVDAELCKNCPFLHICMPDIKNSAIQIDENAELTSMLKRLDELKAKLDEVADVEKEYNAIKELIKKQVEGKDKIVAGEWLITGKWIERKETVIKASKYWKWKAEKLPGGVS
ncbi:MAG: CRISPR-associated protein Cas4 [bacterium]